MSEGYVASAYRLNWVDHVGLMDATVFKGDPLVGVTDTLGGTAHIHSWRCTDCKVVLMDYGARIHYWSG